MRIETIVASDVSSINASVVQGSTIGPSSFSIAESDLRPKRDTFFMDKFADDVDLITTLEYYDQIIINVGLGSSVG